MRITIEPTAEGREGNYPSPKVTVELPTDSLDLEEVLMDLVTPALVGWGFVIARGELQLVGEDEK